MHKKFQQYMFCLFNKQINLIKLQYKKEKY